MHQMGTLVRTTRTNDQVTITQNTYTSNEKKRVMAILYSHIFTERKCNRKGENLGIKKSLDPFHSTQQIYETNKFTLQSVVM